MDQLWISAKKPLFTFSEQNAWTLWSAELKQGPASTGEGAETGVMEEMGPKVLESKPFDPTDFSELGSRPWPGLASL